MAGRAGDSLGFEAAFAPHLSRKRGLDVATAAVLAARDRRERWCGGRAGGVAALFVGYLEAREISCTFNVFSRWASPGAEWADVLGVGELCDDPPALFPINIPTPRSLAAEGRWTARDFDAGDCLFVCQFFEVARGMLDAPTRAAVDRAMTSQELRGAFSIDYQDLRVYKAMGDDASALYGSALMRDFFRVVSCSSPVLMSRRIWDLFRHHAVMPFVAVAFVLAFDGQRDWRPDVVGRAGSSDCRCALCAGSTDCRCALCAGDWPEEERLGPFAADEGGDEGVAAGFARWLGDPEAYPPDTDPRAHLAHAAAALGRLGEWAAILPELARVDIRPDWWDRLGLGRPNWPAWPLSWRVGRGARLRFAD